MSTYTLNIKQLTGVNTKAFSAFIDAVRTGGNFINFCYHYEDKLKYFFENVEYTEVDNGKPKTSLLNLIYGKVDFTTLEKVFKEVYESRQKELNSLLTLKEYTTKELDEVEKNKFLLLYKYGDKVGGYNAVASMSLHTAMQLLSIFSEFDEMKANELKKLLKE